MQLYKGVNNYHIVRYAVIHDIYLDCGDGDVLRVWHISEKELQAKREKAGEGERGTPECFCSSSRKKNDVLMFYPTPDKDYTVTVRYSPPVQEL